MSRECDKDHVLIPGFPLSRCPRPIEKTLTLRIQIGRDRGDVEVVEVCDPCAFGLSLNPFVRVMGSKSSHDDHAHTEPFTGNLP